MILLNIDRIEKGKDHYLKMMDVNELEKYIDGLIQSYYENCFKQDNSSSKSNIADLYQIINLFRTEYPLLNQYVNQRFILIGNTALDSIFNGVVFVPKTKIAIDATSNELMLNSLFDDELMKKILVEENLANIHDFLLLLEDMNNGVSITKNFSISDNKVPRVLYQDILNFIERVKAGEYDNIKNLDDRFLADVNPMDML